MIMLSQEMVIALEAIVGKENVSTDKKDLSGYFKSGKDPELILVMPVDSDQVQNVVKLANARRISIYTVRDKYCCEDIVLKDGILLDTKKMNKIYEVDSLNLHAIIGPGTTFPQLIQEVKRIDDTLKVAMPVAADSPYVLGNYMRRNATMISPTLRGRTIIVSNYHVVLPDTGEIFKSGSHSISEQDHLPDWPGTGGTAASIAFYGMEDALGIPIKAVIWVFPVQACRKKLSIGFPDVAKTKEFIKEHCRKGRYIEAYAANSTFLSVMLAKDGLKIDSSRKDLPAWTVVGSLEGSEELVDVTREILLESAEKLGGKEIFNKYTTSLGATLERPWYVWDRDQYRGASSIMPFYTMFRRSGEFDSIIAESVKKGKYPVEDIGQLLVPMKQARSLYCEYDLYYEPGEEKFKKLSDDSYLDLVKSGAFVDRPQGKIAEYVYSSNPAMWGLQKDIKKKLDPAGILNPDQLIAQEA